MKEIRCCPQCGTDISHRYKSAKFCSRKCKYRFDNPKNQICLSCGIDISHMKMGSIFCSPQCGEKGASEKFIPLSKEIKKCLQCEKDISYKTANAKFCSRLCINRYKSDQIKINKPKRYCKNCNKNISEMGPKAQFCSKKCQSHFNPVPKQECSKCHKSKKIRCKIDNENICSNCYRKDNKEICFDCKKLKVIDMRTDNGEPICGNCRGNRNKEVCFICNNFKKVNARSENNDPICGECYREQNKTICYICSKNMPVNSRLDGNPVCSYCTIYLRKGYSKEEIIRFKKSNKNIHNNIFEDTYDNFQDEKSVSALIREKIFINNIENTNIYLKYDYYFPKEKVLIELNEPCHYSFEIYNKMKYGDEESFQKYQNNFKTKIELAKSNNIDLIVIDLEYCKSKEYYINLFKAKLKGIVNERN